jgi:ADP-heptose:LPS heptosyltransferase
MAYAQAVSAPLNLIDFTSDLADFADMAAVVENLDMVITVDTAVAHLAGAMDKPAWVVAPCPGLAMAAESD